MHEITNEIKKGVESCFLSCRCRMQVLCPRNRLLYNGKLYPPPVSINKSTAGPKNQQLKPKILVGKKVFYCKARKKKN